MATKYKRKSKNNTRKGGGVLRRIRSYLTPKSDKKNTGERKITVAEEYNSPNYNLRKTLYNDNGSAENLIAVRAATPASINKIYEPRSAEEPDEYLTHYVKYYYYIYDKINPHTFKVHPGDIDVEHSKQLATKPVLYSEDQQVRNLLHDNLNYAYYVATQNRQGFMDVDPVFFGQLLEKGDRELGSLVSSNFRNLLGN